MNLYLSTYNNYKLSRWFSLLWKLSTCMSDFYPVLHIWETIYLYDLTYPLSRYFGAKGLDSQINDEMKFNKNKLLWNSNKKKNYEH